jgi:hypothetical protein
MVTAKSSIDIARTMADVWDFLMVLDNYSKWQDGVLRVTASDGTNVGSILTITTFNLGQKMHLTGVVTENDGRSRYAAKSTQGPITFISIYQLFEVSGGTRLEFFNQIETYSVFNLAQPALQAVAQTKTAADIRKLKTMLEAAPVLEPEA